MSRVPAGSSHSARPTAWRHWRTRTTLSFVIDRDDRDGAGVSHDLALRASPVGEPDVVLVEGQQPPAVDDAPGRLRLTKVLRGSSIAGTHVCVITR